MKVGKRMPGLGMFRPTVRGLFRFMAPLLISAVFIFSVSVALPGNSSVLASPGDKSYKEYEVKAAFIYNFLKFVDWPQEMKAKGRKTLVIGVLGEKACKTVSKILQDKTAQGFTINVVSVSESDLKDPRKLAHCDTLFFTYKVKCDMKEVLKKIRQYKILTIGEKEGFLEDGGMINIFIKSKKVYFEINKVALERDGLKLRSKMLRLAKRVIMEDDD